ncbi:MAG TPA: metal ABC transporter permease [Azospirillaceae bacterium]|nr:metal ABC transporter permease [Azospirillaceae bacterium]
MSLLEQAIAVLTFRAGYNSAVVVFGTACLGLAGGTVGTFLLLRRRAMVSDALAHATLPGIAAAFLAGVALGFPERSLPLLLAGAVASAVLAAFLIHGLASRTRLPEDAATAAVLSVFFGLGVVLVSYVQTLNVAGQAGLTHFILGQTAAMRQGEALAIAALALVAAVLVTLLFKELRLVCFDPAFAAAQGWPVGRVDAALMGLATFVTVIGLQTVGLVLVIALLIVPAVAARFWTDRLAHMVAASALIGAVSGWTGATLSALFPRAPAGALIVLAAGGLFLFSFLFAPARGVLALAARHALRRLVYAERLALRRALEAGSGFTKGVSPGLVRWRLRLRGLVDTDGRLTTAGRVAALAAERDARLWDRFVADYPALLPAAGWGFEPVDRALPRDLVVELEARAGWR